MTVQEALKKYNTAFIFHKQDEKAAQAMLQPDEEVLWACDCTVGLGLGQRIPRSLTEYVTPTESNTSGTVVLTDKRLYFANNIWNMRKRKREIALQDIYSIAYSVEQGAAFMLVKSTADAIGIYEPDQKLRVAQEILAKLRDQRQPKAVAAPVTMAPTAAQELREWKTLLDEGIITQEEFDAKKKQVLGL